MDRKKIAIELIRVARNLISSERDSLEEFEGSKNSQIHSSDRVFKSGYTGKVHIISNEKKFYVYLGGSDSSAKSKGARLLKNIDTHWSVPDLSGYDFYVGYDGGIVKVGRSRVSGVDDVDERVAELSKLGFKGSINSLKKRIKSKNVDTLLIYSPDKTNGLLKFWIDSNFRRHPLMDEKFNDLLKKEIIKFYKKHNLKGHFFNLSSNKTNATIEFGKNQEPYKIIKMFIKELENKIDSIRKQLFNEEKNIKNTPEYRKRIDDLKYDIMWDLNHYNYIYESSLYKYANENKISHKEAEEVINKLVSKGKISPVRGGWAKDDEEDIKF